MRAAARRAGLLVIVAGSMVSTGCNPYSTAAKIGIKVVGDVVNDADVSEHSKQLLGQPVAAADAAFGQRIRTLEEIRTAREMITYPVKDDLLDMYRWSVEAENGSIVAVAKLQRDPGGGKDLAEKLVLKEIVVGKTPQEVQKHKYFQKLVLVLRDRASGDLIRVYDVSLIADFTSAKYCVMRFDASNTCQELWIVGVAASSGESSIGT
jgi:hypothetical protein